jgi:hypothetical protein
LRIKCVGEPPDHWPTTRTMRYPADPAALRKGSPEWRRCMVQEVGLPEAWLDFAASGANVPFELADRQGRFDDMMQMLGGGQDADKMRDYLLFHMRMTRARENGFLGNRVVGGGSRGWVGGFNT